MDDILKNLDTLETFRPFPTEWPATETASPDRIARALKSLDARRTDENHTRAQMVGASMCPTFDENGVYRVRRTDSPRIGSVVIAEIIRGEMKGAIIGRRFLLGPTSDTVIFKADNDRFRDFQFNRADLRIIGEVLPDEERATR